MAIEKLNNANYLTWCSDIKQVLIEENAWDIVNGIELRPDTNEVEELKDYEKRSVAALVAIYFNVEREFKNVIADCEKPLEAWQMLKTYCSPENRVLHMKLLLELDTCKMEKDESIVSYVSRVKRISEQIRSIGQTIPEFCVSLQLLKGLPRKFDSVKRKIMKWPDDKFLLKDVIVELITKDIGIKGRKSDNSTLERSSDTTNRTEISSKVRNSGIPSEDDSESSEEVCSEDVYCDGEESELSVLSPRNVIESYKPSEIFPDDGVIESDKEDCKNDKTGEEADGIRDYSEMDTCCGKSRSPKSKEQIGIRINVISDEDNSSDCTEETSSNVSNRDANVHKDDVTVEEKSESGNIYSDGGDQKCSVREYEEKEPENENHSEKSEENSKESSSGTESTGDEESCTSGEPDSGLIIEEETFEVKLEKPTEHRDKLNCCRNLHDKKYRAKRTVQKDKLNCCRKLHDNKYIYHGNKNLLSNHCGYAVFQENCQRHFLRCFKFRRKKLKSPCTHDHKSVFQIFSFLRSTLYQGFR